jgi:hypothetical protein
MIFVGGIWTRLWLYSFPSSLPGSNFWGARFGGVGLGVLLQSCDSSDDDDSDYTASDVYRILCDTWREFYEWFAIIRAILWKFNVSFGKAKLEFFLTPLDSFTNEWVVSKILVRCINTVHMSVVIYDAFMFLLCPKRPSVCCCCTEKYKLSHIHDFTYKRFFIDCNQRQSTIPLSIRINMGSLYRNVSIQNYKRDNDIVS